MKLTYTQHLKTRLKERGLTVKIVKEIFDNAQEYYWDTLRNHKIVVGTINYQEKRRKVLAAYDIIEKRVEVITMHPITDNQIKQRVATGRWQYEKSKN